MTKDYLLGLGSRETHTVAVMCRKKKNVVPFHTTRLAACTHLLSNGIRSKFVFIIASEFNSKLMPKEKFQITIRKPMVKHISNMCHILKYTS